MSNEEMARILNAVGGDITNIIGKVPSDAYLYAEATAGSVEGGIFEDVGDKIIYYDPDDDLFDNIQELWYAGERGKEWGALHYDIKDGKFDARFEYGDRWNADEYTFDRRERALKERFGDKPVIYPPPDESFHELTEADLPKD